jgi:hypothetical protein
MRMTTHCLEHEVRHAYLSAVRKRATDAAEQ